MIPMNGLYMLDSDWNKCEFFKKTESWGSPDKIRIDLISALEKFRKFLEKPLVIHCGTQGDHVVGSAHYRGEAVDLSCPGMNPLNLFLEASRFLEFTGIGLYPYWNRPGIHLDVRHLELGGHRSLWMRGRAGNYIDVNAKNLAALVPSW